MLIKQQRLDQNNSCSWFYATEHFGAVQTGKEWRHVVIYTSRPHVCTERDDAMGKRVQFMVTFFMFSITNIRKTRRLRKDIRFAGNFWQFSPQQSGFCAVWDTCKDPFDKVHAGFPRALLPLCQTMRCNFSLTRSTTFVPSHTQTYKGIFNESFRHFSFTILVGLVATIIILVT